MNHITFEFQIPIGKAGRDLIRLLFGAGVLVDASRLGLVRVPHCKCSLHSAQRIPRRRS